MTEKPDNIIPFPGVARPNGLVLRVDLVLSPRPVWRLLQVAETATFWDLHVALQDVMGWQDCHLHLFTADHPLSGERVRLGVPDTSAFYGSREVLPGWEIRIGDVLRPDHPPILYTYDLGDDWQHEIALEAVVPAAEAGRLPRCLAGEGACPPEDCGGVEGYALLLASLADPRRGGDHPLASVLGRDFAPERFDPANVRFHDPRQRWLEIFGDD